MASTIASAAASATIHPITRPYACPACTAARQLPVAAQMASGTIEKSPANASSSTKKERM